MHCPASVCQERDVKGLWRKAIDGEIQEFTGVSAPYEEPESPDVDVRTDLLSVEQSVDSIMSHLHAVGFTSG